MKQWLVLVMLTTLVGSTAVDLPYKALQDIPDMDVVGRALYSCEGQTVLALSLHHPTKGYFMLWTSAKAWIMAPFGLEHPEEGTVATIVWQGVWDTQGDKTYFRYITSVRVKPDPDGNHKTMCAWLYPTEA